MTPNFGVVVIGRNEGERLVRCLGSITPFGIPIVYVDSNATDGSPDRTALLGVEVVQLDLSKPFTAARARNFGFEALAKGHPDLAYVQFVDDCKVAGDWLPAASAFLRVHPEVAVVCGRGREPFPDASVYNAMCRSELDIPIGETLL